MHARGNLEPFGVESASFQVEFAIGVPELARPGEIAVDSQRERFARRVDIVVCGRLLARRALGDEIGHSFGRKSERFVERFQPPFLGSFGDGTLETQSVAVLEHLRPKSNAFAKKCPSNAPSSLRFTPHGRRSDPVRYGSLSRSSNGRPSGRVKAVDQVNPLHTGLLCFRMRVGRFLL